MSRRSRSHRESARTSAQLTSTPLLARNVAFNLAGWAVPVALALLTVPSLARGFGAVRFGLLNLAWTAVGYFSILDLGLGRAVTQVLAERFGRGKTGVVPEVIWTATLLLLPVTLVLATAAWGLATEIALRLLPTPSTAAMAAEVVVGVRLMAVAVPIMAITNVFRGALEAAQHFTVINALRVPLGVLTFAAPLGTRHFSESVVPAIAILVVGRVVICVAHAIACARAFPRLTRPTGVRGAVVQRLARVGGWITVSNLVNPLLVSADRVIVSSTLGVAAVGYYATPQEVVTKLWIFTGAVLPVLFPALAATFASDATRAAKLFDRAARIIAVALLPVAALMALYAPEWLGWWLGPGFVREGASLVRVFAIAIFCNCVGQTAFTALQAVGQQRVTGVSHLVQLPLLIVALAWVTPRYGLLGAALVWGARIVVDAGVAFWGVIATIPSLRAAAARAAAYAVVGVSCVLATTVPHSVGAKAALTIVAVPIYCAVTWFAVLTSEERASFRLRVLARAA